MFEETSHTTQSDGSFAVAAPATPYWVFRRRGFTRFTFAWAHDPTNRAKRRQVLLPEHLKTEREARRYAELHASELMTQPQPKRSRGVTVADLVDRWIKLRTADERYAASTVKDATALLRQWVVPMLGGKTSDELDVPLLRQWVRALGTAKGRRRKPLAPYTVRNIVRALTWLLDDVQGEGWGFLRGGNPARARAVHSELPEMMPLAGRSQLIRVSETTDAERLLDCKLVPVQRRIRYALAFTSGLRDGELAGLRWCDVDLERATVHVRQALQVKTRGCGTAIGKVKTRASMRLLPLHPAAVAALRAWKSDGWERHVGHAPAAHEPVFCNAQGEPHRPPSATLFRLDAGTAGLRTHVDGHPLTFHSLRRSFATWLRATGAPEEDRRALLGHAGKSTAERHYVEQDVAAMASYVSKIALVWTG
jgi:integrase